MSESILEHEEFRKLLERVQGHSDAGSLAHSCFQLPKVELHAHLNGSISPALMRHFMSRLQLATDGAAAMSLPTAILDEGVLETIVSPRQRMAHCFQVFDAIYQVMTSISFTVLAVQDMLFHFALENTVWLEVRTSLRQTLRWLPPTATGWYHHGASPADQVEAGQADYLDCVIRTIDRLLLHRTVFDLFTSEPIVVSDEAVRYEAARRQLTTEEQRLGDDEFGGSLEELQRLRRWLDQVDEVYGPTFLYAEDASNLPFPTPSLVLSPNEAVVVALGRCRPSDEWLHVISSRLRRHMHCQVLVSVNRGAPVALAESTLDAVEQQIVRDEQRRRLLSETQESLTTTRIPSVVGIDFSGNCSKQHFRDFLPVMQRARTMGLALTYHAGEKVDPEEIDDMRSLAPPDRWGHLVFTEERQRAQIKNDQTPVELCLSSNALTSFHKHVGEHHLSDFWHPEATLYYVGRLLQAPGTLPEGQRESSIARWAQVSFNTDDSGVFATSLTKELLILCDHPLLKDVDCVRLLCGLQREALNHAFMERPSQENKTNNHGKQAMMHSVLTAFYGCCHAWHCHVKMSVIAKLHVKIT